MDAAVKPNPLNSEKAKALQAALAQIEKQFGKGTIMRLGEGEVIEDIQVVSTGSLGLDIALGVGGLPRGRVVEIYGPESSGKTTLTLQVIAEMQKLGGQGAFVDAEHALDIQYAQKLGVKLQDLLISQPDTGEQALEIVDSLVRSGAVDLIVVDSVAALTPKAELEGEMGDSLPGLQARLMSQALRKLTATIKKTNCMVIFINQIRMKIGVMFGSPETTTGGNALKFYASVRLDIRRTGTIKKGDEAIGNETKVKVVKNKVAPAVQDRRVRHPVWRGHQPRGRNPRPRRGQPRDRKVRRLVRLQRRKDRPGPRQLARIPAREPRSAPGDRKQGAHRAGCTAPACGRNARSQRRQGLQGGQSRQSGKGRQVRSRMSLLVGKPLSDELREKIIAVCDAKLASKGADVGLSFYAFFANKNDSARSLDGGGHLVDPDPPAGPLRKGVKDQATGSGSGMTRARGRPLSRAVRHRPRV